MHCKICDNDHAIWDGTDWYCQECLEWHDEQMNDWYWQDHMEEELEDVLKDV